MAGKCLIISGGEFSPIPAPELGVFVIACDRGYEYAVKAGVLPDLIVGDFDSYTGKLPINIPIIRLQSKKDDTDTMVAIKYALDKGYDDITLCCALGKRLDHAYANLQSAVYALRQGAKISVIEADTRIYFIQNGSIKLKRLEGYSLSLFSFTDGCVGVNVKGTVYPLNRAVLTNSFPLGVSNEWKDDAAEISVDNGILMVILSKMLNEK